MSLDFKEIIALARSTKSLTQEQLAQILHLAPRMTNEQLEELKSMMSRLREAEVKKGNKSAKELEVRKKVAAHYSEWKADLNRNALEAQEGSVRLEDKAQAEALIQKI